MKNYDLYLLKGYLKLTNVLSTASNFVDWLAFQEVLGDDMPEDTTDIRKHWYPRIKREWGILISTRQQDVIVKSTSTPIIRIKRLKLVPNKHFRSMI